MSFFFMVSIFLSQWSCINRALLCQAAWTSCPFLGPIFHMPRAFYGMLDLCPADLRISSKMFLPRFLLWIGVEFVSWASFTWKKSSFSELSKDIEFLQVFSQDLLETCATRSYVFTDQKLSRHIFPYWRLWKSLKLKTLSAVGLYLSTDTAPEGLCYLNSCLSTPVYFDLKCVSWVIKESDLWSNSKSVLWGLDWACRNCQAHGYWPKLLKGCSFSSFSGILCNDRDSLCDFKLCFMESSVAFGVVQSTRGSPIASLWLFFAFYSLSSPS